MLGTLNSLIFFNNLSVVTGLTEDADFMRDLFQELHRVAGYKGSNGSYISSLTASSNKGKQSDTAADAHGSKRRNLFLFLQELCLLVCLPLRLPSVYPLSALCTMSGLCLTSVTHTHTHRPRHCRSRSERISTGSSPSASRVPKAPHSTAQQSTAV
jgi:hypothetical protein